ncbi:MAG: SDR family NAD(P)-dependent oxidoreductase, partial [Alphaproteobacteria bacterium]
DQIQAAMDAIRDEFGGLDILVNNAGGQFVSRARDIDFKGFDAVIRNNLSATWYVTKLAADNFFLAGGGRIICVTAPVRAALPGFSHSGAARAGVVSLMKSLAYEWAEDGILCNCVGPGSVKSFDEDHYPIPIENWTRAKRNLLGRMGRTEDVSGAIVFLASELGDYITGEELYVDGGETLYLHNDAADLVAPDLVDTRRAEGRKKHGAG